MNYEWIGNNLEKNPIQKIENSKNQSEIAACEQKTTNDKANFCSNTVSHSTLKLERNFTPQNHSLFGFTCRI